MLDHDLLDAEKEAQNKPLISDLTRYFDTQAEDRASLASIRARLLQKTATTSPVVKPLEEAEEIKLPTPLPLYRAKTARVKPIKRRPYLNALVAACLLVVLIGSFSLAISWRGGGAGSPTVIIKSAITVVALSPTSIPTPILPPIVAQPGYTLVFQQQGNQASNTIKHSTIGQFTASTLFVIHVLCVGAGSVEADLGAKIDVKNACPTYTNYGDIEMPAAANTTYQITVTISGPAYWQVYVEVKN